MPIKGAGTGLLHQCNQVAVNESLKIPSIEDVFTLNNATYEVTVVQSGSGLQSHRSFAVGMGEYFPARGEDRLGNNMTGSTLE